MAEARRPYCSCGPWIPTQQPPTREVRRQPQARGSFAGKESARRVSKDAGETAKLFGYSVTN
jgi:hypothetical protein